MSTKQKLEEKFRRTRAGFQCFNYLPDKKDHDRCSLCQEQWLLTEAYHCNYEHCTILKSNLKEIQEHMAAVDKKANKNGHNVKLIPASSNTKLGKMILLDMEQAIPTEAQVGSNDVMRIQWSTKLKLGTLQEVYLCLLSLEARLKRDWLSKRFDVKGWRQNVHTAVSTKKDTVLIDLIRELDGNIFYTKDQYQQEKKEEAEQAKRRLGGKLLAKEWGFIPGHQYLDKRMNVVCTIHSVVGDRLVVLCGRQERRYTRDEAHKLLQDIRQFEFGTKAVRMVVDSDTSSAGKKRKRRNSGQVDADTNAPFYKEKHCCYCRGDITTTIHIKCGECADVELCLGCFSSGVELDKHKSNHKYFVKENVSTPIYEPHWGADEELLLLDALRKYGFGNWTGVASRVPLKSAEECKNHYIRVYLKGPNAPLPSPCFKPLAENNGDAKMQEKESQERDTTTKSMPAPGASPQPGIKQKMGTPLSWGSFPSKPKAGSSRQKNSSSSSQVQLFPKTKKSTLLPLAQQVGYLIEREDFETEWDNDAEEILADMEFRKDDSESDINLKVEILKIYNAKLDAREKRKQFVLERGLLQRPAPKTPEEHRLAMNYRVWARFHSDEEHQELLKGLLEEKKLRDQIRSTQRELSIEPSSVLANTGS